MTVLDETTSPRNVPKNFIGSVKNNVFLDEVTMSACLQCGREDGELRDFGVM